MFEDRPEWMQRAAFNILKGYKVKSITVSVAVDQVRGYIQQDIVANGGAYALDDVRALIMRQVIDMSDENIKRALRQLGWHHESDQQEGVYVENTCSPGNPLGQGKHFVSVADVAKMERQISSIAKTLHL